jgi:hypothetical protein
VNGSTPRKKAEHDANREGRNQRTDRRRAGSGHASNLRCDRADYAVAGSVQAPEHKQRRYASVKPSGSPRTASRSMTSKPTELADQGWRRYRTSRNQAKGRDAA